MSPQTFFRVLFVVAVATWLPACAHAQEVPLVAAYSMEPDAANPKTLTDSGPLHLDGEVRDGAALVPDGVRGSALKLSGEGANSLARVRKGGLLNRIGSPVTISLWVKPEKLPQSDAAILTKRDAAWQGSPFELDISHDGSLGVQVSNGQKWTSVWLDKALKVGQWSHIALSHASDGELVVYLNGKERKRQKVGGSLASTDNPFVFGFMTSMDFPGGARSPFAGMIDEVRIYGAVLSGEQVVADQNGAPLASRAAVATDFAAPTHYVNFRLARYDMSLAGGKGLGFVNAKAERQSGPDAVDWPQFSLNKTPIWEKEGEEGRFLPLRDGADARPLFQNAADDVIMPGNHWLRPLKGHLHRDVISSDRTARTDENAFQLWTFPVLIKGTGESDIRDVTLKNDGATIYQNAGPLRSLTLLLPQNESGKPYELSVAGRAPVRFDVGLQPITPGNPKNVEIPINLTLAGAPKITVVNAPHAFGAQQQWDDDLKRMGLALAATQTTDVLAARRTAAAKIQNGGADAPPLLAFYPMEPDANDAAKIADIGPLGFDGKPQDATFAAGGKRDNALQMAGGKARASFKIKALNGPIDKLTVAFWVRVDEMPKGNPAILLTKRPAPYSTTPFAIQLLPDGALHFEGNNGAWQTFNTKKKLATGEWHHLALTLQTGDAARLYLDGEAIGSKKLSETPLVANNDPLVFGYEENADFPGGGRSGFVGAFDEARIYLAALTLEQVQADMAGTLVSRAPEGIAAPKTASRIGFQSHAQIVPRSSSWRERVGIEVPRSPLSIYSVSLPHGMSGGHFLSSLHGPAPEWFNKGKKFPGNADDYAQYLADTGFDRVFEQAGDNAFSSEGDRSFDALARALKSRGIGLGLTPDVAWKRPFLTHPNVAFLSYNLPDWHAPLYRSLQLGVQRLNRVGNFAGVSIGADGGNSYVPFWDWAPPNPGTPWSEAYVNQFGSKPPVEAKAVGGTATTRQFLDYVAQQDKTANQYGYFARAVSEINPNAPTTTGSYGPGGVGARGGWSWATNPAREIFAGLPVLQVYDWDETLAHKPLYNVSSLDRLQSYFPDKPAWALMDDFYLKFGRESRQRAYALALTRGVVAIGPNWLAQPSGPQAKPEKVADQKELHAYIHRMGGAYANTRPNATVGILYVGQQSLLRRFNQTGDNKISDAELLAASHDGKTREALFMCFAAGWPAKLITPEEWKRGLPAEMKAVLLTGLTPTDGTWNWYDGLEPQLKTFAHNGGKLLLDNESSLPNGVEGVKTGLQIRGYITQGDGGTNGQSPDKTALLYARNAANLPLLKSAMQGVSAPIATSSDPSIWAIPHTTGEVQYVTVVNNAVEAGQSTAQAWNPKTAALRWNTSRPIYDLRTGQKLSPDAAKTVDLTKDAFTTFALPPREVAFPQISAATGADGFYAATVDVGGMSGVPVQVEIAKGGESATLYGASGTPIKLPFRTGEGGTYSLTATELLSNLRGKTDVTVAVVPALPPSQPQAPELARFVARKDVPLVVALTPEQQKDAKTVALAKKLADFYTGKGRKVETRTLNPGQVVTGLQPNRTMQKYPQWQTVEADLILLGNDVQNPLIFDQTRGGLLNGNGVQVTFSPFVGEFEALNLVADDAPGLEKQVISVTGTR